MKSAVGELKFWNSIFQHVFYFIFKKNKDNTHSSEPILSSFNMHVAKGCSPEIILTNAGFTAYF